MHFRGVILPNSALVPWPYDVLKFGTCQELRHVFWLDFTAM